MGQLANTDAVSALEQAQQAVEELRGQQRLGLESQLTGLVGLCHLRSNQAVEAAVTLHCSVGIAQAIGRIDLEAHHLSILGVTQAMMGAFSDSIGCYERALSLHKSMPPSAENDLLLARVLANFGTTYLYMGLLDKALPLFQQARDYCLRLGHARGSALCLGNLASAHVLRAERLSRQPSSDVRAQALAEAREALALAEQIVADPSMEAEDKVTISAHATIVSALTILGDCTAALEKLNRIDHYLTSEAHHSFFRAERSTLRARLLRLTGRPAEAVAELQAVPLDDLAHSDRVGLLEELALRRHSFPHLNSATNIQWYCTHVLLLVYII